MVADVLTILSFCVLCINKLIPAISQVGSVVYNQCKNLIKMMWNQTIRQLEPHKIEQSV